MYTIMNIDEDKVKKIMTNMQRWPWIYHPNLHQTVLLEPSLSAKSLTVKQSENEVHTNKLEVRTIWVLIPLHYWRYVEIMF